jgi:hypothetical protein
MPPLRNALEKGLMLFDEVNREAKDHADVIKNFLGEERKRSSGKKDLRILLDKVIRTARLLCRQERVDFWW